MNSNVVDLQRINKQQLQLYTKNLTTPNEATHTTETVKKAYDSVIIATGNQLPQKPPAFVERVSDQYINTLYAPATYKKISDFSKQSEIRERTVVIIGTGLSALDAILTLNQSGYTGKIMCISRHGYNYFRYNKYKHCTCYRDANILYNKTPDFLERVNKETSIAEVENWVKDYLKEVLNLNDDTSFYDFMVGSFVSGKPDDSKRNQALQKLLEDNSRYIAELARKLAPETARALLDKYRSAINSHRIDVIPDIYDPVKKTD